MDDVARLEMLHSEAEKLEMRLLSAYHKARMNKEGSERLRRLCQLAYSRKEMRRRALLEAMVMATDTLVDTGVSS